MSLDALYVIGAPRSGTTWLQHLMGAHPRVATPQETELFVDYVAAMEKAWSARVMSDDAWQRNRHRGLPAVLTKERLQELLTDFVTGVYDEVLALKPSADIVLEKVPRYSLYGPLIQRYVPDATFVHIIRDARDVVASLLRARRGWGQEWAPSLAEEAAITWRDHVRSARAVQDLTDRYVEIRYEDLGSANGPAELHRVMTACGLECTLDECERIHSESRSALVWGGEVRERLGRAPEEPEGFIGPARPGAWERELRWHDRWAVDHVAGDLLIELGYATSGAWARRDPRARLLGPVRLRYEKARFEWQWRSQQIRDAVRRY